MSAPLRHRITRLPGLPLALAALLACTLAGCGGKDSGKQPPRVSGTLVVAPGQYLPTGMPVELELIEATAAAPAVASTAAAPVAKPADGKPAAGPKPLASGRVQWQEGSETPFSLDYDAKALRSGSRYLVRARATLTGNTFLAGQSLAPVPAGDPPIPVDVVLRRPDKAPPLYLDVSVLRLGYKRGEDWSRLLREVMPAIGVCLRSVSGEGLAVVKAWPKGDGRIGVRIRGPEGSGFDCTALPDGSKFESLAGLPSFAAPLPGEGTPTFVPAPHTPKMDDCRRYERVLGGLSEPLGWLVYDACPKAQPAPGGPPPAGRAPATTATPQSRP